MTSGTLFYALVCIFIVLNVLDAHSTLKVINKSSYHNEKNPIARLLFKLLGPLAGVIVLKVILVPVIFLMFYLFEFSKYNMNLVLVIANVFYLAVVINNYNVVKKLNRHRQMMNDMNIDDE